MLLQKQGAAGNVKTPYLSIHLSRKTLDWTMSSEVLMVEHLNLVYMILVVISFQLYHTILNFSPTSRLTAKFISSDMLTMIFPMVL